MSNKDIESKAHLVPAYHKMMTRVEQTHKESATTGLQAQIEAAQEQAVALNELSREEAEHIGDYLRRDLQDAAEFIISTEQSLADWMRFDLALIEDSLLDMFSLMVDKSSLELENLAESARQATEWQSGEITALGTLNCEKCGHSLHFQKPDYIPACPNCGATRFKREI